MRSEEEGEDEDEVVQELDVFLSKSLCGHLYMLQYPVQGAKSNYGPQDRSISRIKPKNNKIEMEVVLDISSPNYDQSKGEQIALNVDGNASTVQASTTFESNVMDKQILHSTAVPSQGKRYVAGFVQNGEVHLTPISHVLQLRPSFKYMDHAEQRALQAAKAKAAAEAGDSSQDEVEEAKAVTIRFKGAETEAARLARERSYAAYEKRLAEEKWITTKFHHKKESYAERERQRLVCQSGRQQAFLKVEPNASGFSEMVQSPSEYLADLVPVYTEHSIDNSALPNNILSISRLKNETLADQLKLLMKNAKIIHFSHLMSLLPKPPDLSTVVRSLQSFAVLVRGCWIVKSDVLFPPGTQSPISGIPSENLCTARDYILYLFTKSEYLVRREVASTVEIPGDDVKAIFEDIAVMHMGRGWRLRLAPDLDFTKRFPEVQERQDMLWDAQGTKLNRLLKLQAPNEPTIKEVRVFSPPRKKKGNVDQSTPPASKQHAKTLTKKQKKVSGQKPGPKANSNAANVAKDKNQLVSPSANEVEDPVQPTMELKSANHVHPAAVVCSSPKAFLKQNIAYSNDGMIVTGSPRINVEGVNSTLQSIADQMIKMGSQEQKSQYYIPQMNIAKSNLQSSPPVNREVSDVATPSQHNGAAAASTQGQIDQDCNNRNDAHNGS